MNLIYADNGSGKTTLTAIFRSLTTNSPELLRKRVSINATIHQAVQIVQRVSGTDTFHTFGTNGWTVSFPEIEIFDSHFVSDNIYSGFDFKDGQKKHLHRFVIGAAGVGVRLQIQQNKDAKAVSRTTQDTLEANIISTVGNGLTAATLNSFISTPVSQATNIDQKIATAEAALVSANANALIRTLPQLTTLQRIAPLNDFAMLVTDLETNIATLMDGTLRVLFEGHCQELSTNGLPPAENWLKAGFGYFAEKNNVNVLGEEIPCPFCQQPIGEDFPIIQSYTVRFNDAFNALVGRMALHKQMIESINLDHIISNLSSIHAVNITRTATWAVHLPATATAPIFNIIANEQLLRDTLRLAIHTINSKIQNPTVAIETTTLTELNNLIASTNANIAAYNSAVSTYNAATLVFISGLKSVSQAQAEVANFKRVKARFETNVVNDIAALTTERTNLRNLDTAYAQLIVQQRTAASAFFSLYKDRINHYLTTVFRTPFLIDDVAHVSPQGKSTESKLDYKLTIHGTDISFDESNINSARECLSEGDKSTIALAFFLSKLDIDTTTSNKVIIFDDPLSSFDSNRRLYTVELIKDLLPRIKQLLVFSHNERFLYEIYKTIGRSQCTSLIISENFVTNSAFIAPLILEDLVENDYFKHCRKLQEFLSSPDISQKDVVLGWIRNVLEAHLRFKFYRQLNTLAANDRTFGRIITTLSQPTPVTFRDSNTTAVIGKLNLLNGVSCKPHHGEPVPDYGVLGIDPATINVTQLANLIQDTFDLIDNRL